MEAEDEEKIEQELNNRQHYINLKLNLKIKKIARAKKSRSDTKK